MRFWTADGAERPPAFVENDGAFMELGGEGDTLGYVPRGDISPDGNWIVLRAEGGPWSREVVSTATGIGTAPPDLKCELIRWEDATHVLTGCRTDAGGSFATLDVTTGDAVAAPDPYPNTYRSTGPWLFPDLLVSPGVWVGNYGDMRDGASWAAQADFAAGVDEHGTLREIVILDAAGQPAHRAVAEFVRDGVVYLAAEREAWNDNPSSPDFVVAYTLATGRQTILIPEPPAGPASASDTSGDGIGDNPRGVTSWVVAQ